MDNAVFSTLGEYMHWRVKNVEVIISLIKNMSPKEKIVIANSFEEIVFNLRNKEYGAFYLRKKYKKILLLSFFIAFFIVSSVVLILLINNYQNKKKFRNGFEKTISVILENVDETLPPPPPPLFPTELQAQVKFVAPTIVDTVKEEITLATFDENLAAAPEIITADVIVHEKKAIEKEDVVEKEEPVFLVVEEPATFQGGDPNKFNAWILKNIRYPQVALEMGVTGRVFVKFAVNSRGQVVDAVIMRGIDPALDQEAIRVIMSSPKWTPPKQGGRPVKQQFVLPVIFTLHDL